MFGLVLLSVLVSLLSLTYVPANWPLYEGYRLKRVGDATAATVKLNQALSRMDQPGVPLPGRQKLTAYGPVQEFRVTALISLASIEKARDNRFAAVAYLERAKRAGLADSREAVDIAELDRLIIKLRAEQ